MSHDDDPTLNIYSKLFDAKKALKMKIHIPHDIYPLRNLYATRVLLPKSHPDFMEMRIVDPTRLRDDQAFKDKMMNQEKERELRKQKRIEEMKSNPLKDIVESINNGPFMLLRESVEQSKKIRVITRRIDGVRGTCTGYLKAFDKNMNMLMFDVDEEYSCYAYEYVSDDGHKCNTSTKLAKFFKLYNPEKVANASSIYEKYRGNERDLWKFLHGKYGLTMRVQQHIQSRTDSVEESGTKAEDMLFAYAGRECILMCKLGIENDIERAASSPSIVQAAVDVEPIVYAEWIRMESKKYPGKFFYFNSKTKQPSWTPPENVRFKTLKYLTTRKRHMNQLLIRGDCVIMCTLENENPKPFQNE